MKSILNKPAAYLTSGISARYREMACRTDTIKRMKNIYGYGSRTGGCGDTIEMFFTLKDQALHEVLFIADGCINTVAGANAAAQLARGKCIEQAWNLTPDDVTAFLETLPADEVHCAQSGRGALYPTLFSTEKT